MSTSAIDIRRLTRPEIFAYVTRGHRSCGVGGCRDGFIFIAVYAKAGRVERDLLCGTHGAAWAARRGRALPIPAVLT